MPSLIQFTLFITTTNLLSLKPSDTTPVTRRMNFMQKSTAKTSRDRAHQIITGKRTEHQRPCSSLGMAPETTSSSYNGGDGCMFSYYTTGSSPTMSSDEEEEEDMANCLIMLAHSVSPAKENKSDLHCQKNEKLKNRKLTEMAATTTAGAKSDFQNYYECKTCNRTFPSFQALGGHRASHKKPKLSVEDRKSVSVKTESTAEDQPEVESKIITNHNKSPRSLTGYKNSKGKVHECSICGSEFLSGQALGGHMRRHRPPPVSNSQIAVSSNMDDTTTRVNHSPKRSPAAPVLSLDLNLPAPEVVDDVHSNFQYTANSPKQPLVFSVTALVDCHY
ncbi:unnamed protein product [Lactuca virosa]|uniref:C2H2-type domain-containing protein n=1 Tax=Lactuca virosa TaxID=75947 RepID=A0AAU9MTQ9_9ASTR|nr:unnamed protein product [Lactuca virosa]